MAAIIPMMPISTKMVLRVGAAVDIKTNRFLEANADNYWRMIVRKPKHSSINAYYWYNNGSVSLGPNERLKIPTIVKKGPQ